MSLLKTIDSPADLKRVPVEQLPVLAEEIREQIVSVTSAVGGHVASNLGVVELTVALHYLLDTPKATIAWATSNQAYAHKLLTGRREHLRTLQKDLLVILNDKQMSISRNVGSLSAYLNRTFTGEFVTHVKEEAKHLLKAIPRVGDQLTRLAHRAEELAKGLVLPGLLFEELG